MREYLNASDLDEAESKGLVADSKMVRLALLEKVTSGLATMEDVQAELRTIQRQANSIGLYTRNDFFNKNGVDIEAAKESKRLKDLQNLNKKLNKNLPLKGQTVNKNKI